MKLINRVIRKQLTLQEFLELKTKLRSKAEARTKNFNDNRQNYYWYRIEEIDKQYPQFKSVSKVRFK